METALPFGVLPVMWSIWMWMICDQIARQHRLDLVDHVFSRPDAQKFWDVIRCVPHRKHRWYLATFRNPRRLYPAELAEAF